MDWFSLFVVLFAIVGGAALHAHLTKPTEPRLQRWQDKLKEIASKLKQKDSELARQRVSLDERLKMIEARETEYATLMSKPPASARAAAKAEGREEAKGIVAAAKSEAAEIKARARVEVSDAKHEASGIRGEARAEAERARSLAASEVRSAQGTVSDLTRNAEEIAEAIVNSEAHLQLLRDCVSEIAAQTDDIDYADLPRISAVDALAESYGHIAPGAAAKAARKFSREQARKLLGAECEHPDQEASKRIRKFLIESFDARFAKAEALKGDLSFFDLAAEIRRDWAVINAFAASFWSARVTEGYLASRLEELRNAILVIEHRQREKEEQRQLRAEQREEAQERKRHEDAARKAERESSALRESIERERREAAAREAEVQARLAAELANALAVDRERILAEHMAALSEQEGRMRDLEDKLREAEERGRRELSMAQQTRVGNVYVISNRGSFGDGVYKIGMTRRLEPMERVIELGDASVPFSFDVHAMIATSDAPALERALHERFALARVNKVNLRKEFFRTSITDIKREVEAIGAHAMWTMAADAREYQETKRIDDAGARDPSFWQKWLDGVGEIPEAPIAEDDGIEPEELETA